jgi:hypothetical protein
VFSAYEVKSRYLGKYLRYRDYHIKRKIEMRRRSPITNTNTHEDDSWIGILWKPAAAVIYLLICLFDFVVVPVYLGVWAPKLNDIILAIKDLPPESQVIVLNLKLAAWEPLTLKGGGLFHVAFGAILGATVWTRGQERVNEIKQGWGSYDTGYNQGFDNAQAQGPMNPPVVNNQVQPTPNGAPVDNPDEHG